MAKWTLTDNSTGSPVVLTFDINPNTFDTPGRNSNIITEQTTAPNGQTLVFQGRDKAKEASFAGAVLTQSFYNDLDTWKNKHYPLVLTDDQGSTWDVIFRTWRWKRIHRTNNWRYDYQATVLVL
jgi:hypothetical protein